MPHSTLCLFIMTISQSVGMLYEASQNHKKERAIDDSNGGFQSPQDLASVLRLACNNIASPTTPIPFSVLECQLCSLVSQYVPEDWSSYLCIYFPYRYGCCEYPVKPCVWVVRKELQSVAYLNRIHCNVSRKLHRIILSDSINASCSGAPSRSTTFLWY